MGDAVGPIEGTVVGALVGRAVQIVHGPLPQPKPELQPHFFAEQTASLQKHVPCAASHVSRSRSEQPNANVGIEVGKKVGTPDGSEVGMLLGALLGATVGIVGASDGDVGAVVGAAVHSLHAVVVHPYPDLHAQWTVGAAPPLSTEQVPCAASQIPV